MRRTTTALAAVLLVSTGLTACSDDGSPGAGFVSMGRRHHALAVDDRKEPGEVAGETLEGEPISPRTSRQDGRGERLGLVAPCRAEAPESLAASEELAADDVEFLGINSRDLDRAAAQAFQRRFALPEHLRPAGQDAARLGHALSPNAIPSTVVIDAEGRVAASVIGEVSRSTLVGLVEDVMAGEG